MFEILKIEVTLFQQNARLLYCPDSREAVLIDPGGEGDKILSVIKEKSLSLTQIWLTHSHLDHCGGVSEILRKIPAKLYAHKSGKELRSHVVDSCRIYGVFDETLENCPEPESYIEDGQTLSFQDFSFKVLHTPGHSPDSLCFYHTESKTLLSGDTLFAGSIGRTDLPGGDSRMIIKSIKDKILSLPLDTKVLSGHGPESTVGNEKKYNPFLAGV